MIATVLNTKISGVENKIVVLNTKIAEIGNKTIDFSKYIATPGEIFDPKIKQANLVGKNDFDDKLISLNKKIQIK